MKTSRCPLCSKPVDPALAEKVTSPAFGTGRRGAPGYSSQSAQTKLWHRECLEKFEAQRVASREQFLAESQRQMEEALRQLREEKS